VGSSFRDINVSGSIKKISSSFRRSCDPQRILMALNIDTAPRRQFDAATLKAALRGREGEIITRLRGPHNRAVSSRKELRWGNGGSLSLVLHGSKAGLWHDHEQGRGGDIITFVELERACTFYEALEYLAAQIGDSPLTANHAPRDALRSREADADAGEQDKYRRMQGAQEILEASQSARGTLAAEYLRSRGLDLPASDVLSFHPACPWDGGRKYPSLIAPITDVITGELVAIQKTALSSEARKIDRRTMGPVTGDGFRGVVRLEEKSADELIIAEGVETALSVVKIGEAAAVEGFDTSAIWSVLDTNGMKSFPVLRDVGRLTIIVDNDVSGAGQKAAQECLDRWRNAGKTARVHMPPEVCGHEVRRGSDLNDYLLAADEDARDRSLAATL
jgi:putative DNA primase/helicase